AIAKRLTELYRTDAVGSPQERNERYFFSKRLANEDLSKIYIRKGLAGADELLVDPLPWSADHSASATLEGISADGRVLFYWRRDGGQDEITLHALNVDSKKELPDTFPKAEFFSVEPTADGHAVYYVRRTPTGPRTTTNRLGPKPPKTP